MRRKRLNHAPHQLCQVFCGWRLHSDKPTLVRLGDGKLVIDALTGQCQFRSKDIRPLGIATELRVWLAEDLARYGIPIDSIQEATLTADLSFSEIPWSEGSTDELWFNDGRQVEASTLVRCMIRCDSMVSTDEAEYRSALKDLEEWPPGWPAA